MKPESKIQAQILRYLRTLGQLCWAIKAAVCNERGVPDILCCYRARFVAFEVKTARGRISGPQAIQHKRIRQAGGQAFIVRSIDEVKAVLREIDSNAGQEADDAETI